MTELALDMQFAAMGVNQVLHDTQTQPGPAQLASAGPIYPIEALGNPREIHRGDPGAGVADDDFHEIAVAFMVQHRGFRVVLSLSMNR